MKLFNLSKSFNWRILLVRILVNAVTLVVLAILPGITFVDPSLGKLLLMALVLGLINAFVKPILQFLTLSFLFVTYGFVLILINAIVLLLLARLFQSYQLASIWAALARRRADRAYQQLSGEPLRRRSADPAGETA